MKVHLLSFILSGFIFGYLVGNYDNKTEFKNIGSYIPLLLVNSLFLIWRWNAFKNHLRH